MMRRGVAVAALAAVIAVAFPAASSGVTSSEVRSDLEHYFAQLELIHPNPYHSTSKADMRAAADRIVAEAETLNADQLLVRLMRFAALLGEREGHAGLFPFASHRRTLHAFPLWTYSFPEGIFVVATAGAPRVGERLVAIDGHPIADVLARIEPLTTRDNAHNLRGITTQYLLTAEVLHGLGVTSSAARATFTFERGGTRRDVELAPIPIPTLQRRLARAYPTYFVGLPRRAKPLFVSRKQNPLWLTTLDRGRVVYLSYNLTFARTDLVAQRLLRLARKPRVRRIVIDLRNNPGGNINTYPPLLDALIRRAVNRPGRLFVLIGRPTFSAAVHFAVDVERLTHATLVGEPTGGAPNHFSDTDPVTLENAGLTVLIPTRWYEKHPGRPGLTVEPEVSVELTAADFFAGRDPVLRAARTGTLEAKAAAAATFQDPAGDAGSAPDITSVTVEGDRTGEMSFRIPLTNFDGEAQLFVAVDVDAASDTGDRNGIEFVLDARPDGQVRVRQWNGSAFVPFTEAATSFSYTAGVATFRIDAPYLGLLTFMRFGVVSTRGSSSDAAPNNGAYRYRAIPPMVVRFVPRRPVAGKRFTFSSPGAAYVYCYASLGGKRIRGDACTWKLPRSARGKAFVVQVSVDGELRTFRFRVR